MPPVKDAEKVTREFVDVAFDAAYELRESYGSFLTRRKANRDQLRSLAAQGYLSDEQVAELDELYPPRQVAAQESEESQAAA